MTVSLGGGVALAIETFFVSVMRLNQVNIYVFYVSQTVEPPTILYWIELFEVYI